MCRSAAATSVACRQSTLGGWFARVIIEVADNEPEYASSEGAADERDETDD